MKGIASMHRKQKDLNETYLPAFKSLVDVNVETIMCAYNRTNNEPCCGSNELINNILRNSWGLRTCCF